MTGGTNRWRILIVFGTRPEIIKLAPVVRSLASRTDTFETLIVSSGQHQEILLPFLEELDISVDRALAVGRPNQTPTGVAARVLGALEPVIDQWKPDAVIVQGDTTTALAGALAAFHAGLVVGHVEAGLRSGDPTSPFPEEMNRRLISQVTSLHFAATARNRQTLLDEGVDDSSIALTGNPVVDTVRWIMERHEASPRVVEILSWVGARRLLLLTTHRRESFGEVMEERMRTLAGFAKAHPEVALVFPVHPNPHVKDRAQRILAGSENVLLVPPLGYADFIHLFAQAWLMVSDSGGIQEEAPSLGKPVILIRDNTERPEAIESGVVRLVTDPGNALGQALESACEDNAWIRDLKAIPNPFGQGDAGEKIADALTRFLGEKDAGRARGSGNS